VVDRQAEDATLALSALKDEGESDMGPAPSGR